MSGSLQPTPALVDYEIIDTDQTKVYWVDYDMVQSEIIFISKEGRYDPMLAPEKTLYNEYFGGGMGSVVFQEIREAQGLAYSVWANYGTASKASGHDQFLAYIGTQADKQKESMEALLAIINELPESKVALETAKKAIMNKIESERITKTSVLFNYEDAKRKNLDYDIRETIYEGIQNMTFEDLEAFQEKHIKNNEYNMLVLGSKDKLDFDALRKYGDVTELSLEEIFGYEKVDRIALE